MGTWDRNIRGWSGSGRRCDRSHILVSSSVILCWIGIAAAPCRAADLAEVIKRATATLQSDWAADPDYAYIERDEVLKNEKPTSKTAQVVYIGGSDYNFLIAVDDQPLSPDREKVELQKLKVEVQRRNGESPAARRQRIERYTRQRSENTDLVLDFPNAFTFELLREETINSHLAYVLSATPRSRTGPTTGLSNAAKVLSGMHGTLWIDKEGFHAIRAECDVIAPVPIYGILAKVLPGTHVEFEMMAVTDSTWLISEFSMRLTVAKVVLFKSKQVTRSTFSSYRPNSLVVDELLSKAGD